MQSLPEYDWRAPQAADSQQWQAYRDFYQLDFLNRFNARHCAGFMHSGNYKIALQRFSQRGARSVAVLVHGYYDHVGIYGSLIEFCLAQGWDVMCFDLPGHGLSTGELAAIDSFQEYDQALSQVLQQLQAYDGAPVRAFGQSTGGAILINYLLKRQPTVEQSPFRDVTLLAPLVRPHEWTKARVLHTLLRPFLKRVKRSFGVNSGEPEFLHFIAERDPLQARYLSVRWVGALRHWVPFIEAQPSCQIPINIIQGDNDMTVDWCHNLEILAQKFPQQRRMIVPGGHHHLVNESAPKRALIYQQLAEWLQ